jgi:hypothetical protein
MGFFAKLKCWLVGATDAAIDEAKDVLVEDLTDPPLSGSEVAKDIARIGKAAVEGAATQPPLPVDSASRKLSKQQGKSSRKRHGVTAIEIMSVCLLVAVFVISLSLLVLNSLPPSNVGFDRIKCPCPPIPHGTSQCDARLADHERRIEAIERTLTQYHMRPGSRVGDKVGAMETAP